MRTTKIVLIGAGSAVFGLQMLRDAVNISEIRGSTISLVDVDSKGLEAVAALAHKLNEESGAGLKIEHTTDRTKALPGAEFIVISIAVNRLELWKLDWQIPIKHGIKHTLGENSGPDGLFHTFRNIPIVLDICKDIERLCPDALIFNFTNPVPRICMAIDRYTDLKSIGLCHGVSGHLHYLEKVMDLERGALDGKAAGVNHFDWFLDLRYKATGEDAYPEFMRKLEAYDPTDQPLSRKMYEMFGFYPAPGDDHIGEFIPYATDYCGMDGFDFDNAERRKNLMWEKIGKWIRGEEPVTEFIGRESGERPINIIAGILSNSNHYEMAVNIPNDGHISNLSHDAIVEVPALVSADGVRGLSMGMLPPGIAAMCQAQIWVQELAVEAAVTGDKDLALQAMLVDPTVHGAEAAERVLDELLALEADYLPQFTGGWQVIGG